MRSYNEEYVPASREAVVTSRDDVVLACMPKGTGVLKVKRKL